MQPAFLLVGTVVTKRRRAACPTRHCRLGAFQADLAAKRTQLKAGSSHHPRLQQQIPGTTCGKTVCNRKLRIRLSLDGACLDVDESAGGNRDLEVSRMTGEQIFACGPRIALIGDSTAS